MKIILANEVTLNKGMTSEEGRPIGQRIAQCLKNNESVELDFTGMELITTAFLNVVIGTLYKDYTSEQLKGTLSFAGLNEEFALRIKRVTDNAKLFYKNPEKFQEDVDSAIYGNS